MSLGGEVLVVGSYAVTWNAVSLGIMHGEEGVPTIIQVPKSRPINNTDKYGDSKIDSIHRGVEYWAEMVCQEYLKGLTALCPWAAAFGEHGLPGVLKYSFAAALVFTAVAGTSAATSPATLTASKAVLADDHQTRLPFGPVLRTVGLRFDLMPYIASLKNVSFTTT
jgi:hypothetical protein